MISLLVFNKRFDMHKTVLLSNQNNSYGGSYDFEQLPPLSLPLQCMQYGYLLLFRFQTAWEYHCITVR